MTSGPALFCRFAHPPNRLGYCGPEDTALLAQLVAGGAEAEGELRRAILDFSGAWPYLELIGGVTGRDPLDPSVVEAYWLGGPLLQRVDLLTWGTSVDDRFRRRAGAGWGVVADALDAGGRPSHAFHVFCVYPWVGLLRSGSEGPALRVLDRCRVRSGTVDAVTTGGLVVTSRPLTWDGRTLGVGPDRPETVLAPVDDLGIAVGDIVAMHWDHVCSPLSETGARWLERDQARHLAIANRAATAGSHLLVAG